MNPQEREGLVNYSKYDENFGSICNSILHEPVQERRCTDAFCIAIFAIFTIGFLGIGFYEISEYQKIPRLDGDGNLDSELYFVEYASVVIGGAVASIIISLIYVLLIKAFPRVMVYAMIILSLGLMAILAILGLIVGNIGLAIGMGISLLIYLLVLACLRKKIQTGIAFVSAATKFVSDKMYVFVTPLIKIVLSFIVGIFYVFSLSCIIAVMNHKQERGEDDSMQIGFTVYFVFMWLLFLFLFYYMMTYTIAVVCAHWYYGLQGRSSLATAYKWIFKQFGSLVFASFVIAVVTLIRMMINSKRQRNNNNVAAAICLCIMACLVKCVEDLIKVLNHYTIILMAVTGESYIQGAKTTMGLLWKQLGMLQVTNIICNFLVLWGLIVSVGIPCIISYFWMKAKDTDPNDQGAVIGLVAALSMLLSMIVYEIIVESVGCIFIFYSMDRQFIERGLMRSSKIPQQTFDQINRMSENPYGNEDSQNRM